jgi:hypothetical protein
MRTLVRVAFEVNLLQMCDHTATTVYTTKYDATQKHVLWHRNDGSVFRGAQAGKESATIGGCGGNRYSYRLR